MLDCATKRRVNVCREILFGELPDPESQVRQIMIALVYKFMSDMDLESESLGGRRRFFTGDLGNYCWPRLVAPDASGKDMQCNYSKSLAMMAESEPIPSLFRLVFQDASLPCQDSETFRAFLQEIGGFIYDCGERPGNAFEYLLSALGSEGNKGEFRTPRHIVDFMVEIVDPKKGEVILDPACGTGGFLISACTHILRRNSTGSPGGNLRDEQGGAAERALESPSRYAGDLLTSEERACLHRNLRGYEISRDMMRFCLMNLYLHGFADPRIEEHDTLASECKWGEMADVILANPPFMSPPGGIKAHARFRIKSRHRELLFADYVAQHLNPGGRAAIIVPEGMVFEDLDACRDARKMLAEECLAAVISLQRGVFGPYSRVKASILVLDKVVAKASGHIGFFTVENDGFAFDARRKPIKGSQLEQVKTELSTWLQAVREGEGGKLECSLGKAIERGKVADIGNHNLRDEARSLD